MTLFFVYIRGVEQIQERAERLRDICRTVVLRSETGRDAGLAAGGAQDGCLRETLQGLRDREVRQGTKLTYEKDMITERDYQNIIDTAAEDGRAEGFAEGRSEGLAEGEAKGKAEERVMIAKAMIEEGIDTNTIAKVTGLSCEEIASL